MSSCEASEATLVSNLEPQKWAIATSIPPFIIIFDVHILNDSELLLKNFLYYAQKLLSDCDHRILTPKF